MPKPKDMQDQLIKNVIKYGEAKPSVLKRVFGRWFGGSNTYVSGREFWTALYTYSRASKGELVKEGYAKNATIYSVISTIARLAAQAPCNVYRVKSARGLNRLKSLQAQPYSAKRDIEIAACKEHTLEIVESHYLNDIFANPNEQQGATEYLEAIYSYKLLTGNSYEYAEMNGSKVAAMWALPAQHVEILTDEYGTFPTLVKGYKVNIGGHLIDFDTTEVCHSKYFNPYYSGSGDNLYGFSPLEAAWLSTIQDNSAKEAAVEQLKNRGVRGIFTVESDKINEYSQFAEMMGDLHTSWQQNSKNYKDRIMPIFGRGQWHNVGLSISDLSIIELSNLSAKDIYNVYGVSEILFNNSGASTYDNYKTARKELITRCVLPLITSIRDARNRKLKPFGDWNNTADKLVCDFDTTIYTELFEDVWGMAMQMRNVGAFTDNEIRIAANYERLEMPYMDDVWKPSNLLPTTLRNDRTTNQRPANQRAESQDEQS